MIFDIQLAAFLLDPSRREAKISDLFARYLDSTLPEEGDLHSYIAHCLPQLQEVLTAQLQEEHLWELFTTLETPLLHILHTMEARGIKIDIAYLKSLSQEMTKEMEHLEEDIFRMAGEEFNINSPKQLQVILFEKLGLQSKKKTKTGLSTNVQVLSELALFHPLPAKILDYRQYQKLLSTYINALPELADKQARVHTSFNQTIAATGRLSSTDPNLQNIPIRTTLGKKIRKAFIPEEGYMLLSADYSQVELRMLAHFSEDPALIEAFLHSDSDVHALTAAKIFGKDPKDVSNEERRMAKTVNFGIIYGMGPFKLSQDLKISRKEATDFIARYFETYTHVHTYMEGLEKKAKEDGFLTTIKGRKRAFPELQSANRVLYEAAKREAINFPIQGSAADLIKLAMIAIHEEFTKRNLKSRMVLQIHDELLFEVLPEEATVVVPLVTSCMQHALELKVPLKVEVGMGKNWLEAH